MSSEDKNESDPFPNDFFYRIFLGSVCKIKLSLMFSNVIISINLLEKVAIGDKSENSKEKPKHFYRF